MRRTQRGAQPGARRVPDEHPHVGSATTRHGAETTCARGEGVSVAGRFALGEQFRNGNGHRAWSPPAPRRALPPKNREALQATGE